jgi:predicted secreted protein
VLLASVNPGSLLITVIYTLLLAWGFSVGARQIWQGFKQPRELLNPLFGNRVAIELFTLHIVVVSADLFVIGPWAIAHKSPLWYWGGRIALLSSSLPLATYLNRNPQSFGKLIGRWVVFRNFFEYTLHVLFAALALSWFRYYLLLWWIVAYRYLDVGPRRLLQRLYNTPEKRAARPWAPLVNWATIATLYVLTFFAIYHRQVLYADVPADDLPLHVPHRYEIGIVVGFNVALVLVTWVMTKRYTESLLRQAADTRTVPDLGEIGAH